MIKGWKRNVSLKPLTSFQIGGRAKFFTSVFSEEELEATVKKARERVLPLFVLSGGTNLLIPDKGFPGLVVKISLGQINWQKNRVKAEAGVPLPFLVEEARGRGLSKLEWAAGIPGLLGGAIRGNAGTKEEYLSGVLEKVRVFNQETLSFQELFPADCQFGYRRSIFQKRPELIITSASLKLTPASLKEIEARIANYLEARRKQPLNFPSAGSIFKNPTLAPAGWLIEQAGLKGRRVGQAQVSSRHANFIVNLGRARSGQVLALIEEIETRIKRQFGISLEREIVVLENEGKHLTK